MKTCLIVRTFFAAALATALALPVCAASKNKLDARIRDLTDYFEKVQRDPAKAVPPEILAKAEGVVIMRNYRAGFIVGVTGGAGVATVKDKATGQWSPVGFIKAGEGSFGFQAGAQRNDMILILMNSQATRLLTDPNLKIGVDIRATVGPRSAGDQANLKTDDTPVLVYGDTRGLFGGASVETGGVFPDARSNEEYYGKKLTMSEILLGGKVERTDAAKGLIDKIQLHGKAPANKADTATSP